MPRHNSLMWRCPTEGALDITESNPLNQQGTHRGPERAGHLPRVTEQLETGGWQGLRAKNASTEGNREGQRPMVTFWPISTPLQIRLTPLLTGKQPVCGVGTVPGIACGQAGLVPQGRAPFPGIVWAIDLAVWCPQVGR